MTAQGSGPRRLVATVRGYVQGVGFRWFVQREAARLGLSGWVANQPDGSVAVEAEGAERELGILIDVLRQGPEGAAVSRVDVRYEPSRGEHGGFAIRSGAHRGD